MIEKVITNSELSDDDKVILVEKIVNASHGIDRFINSVFYLRATANKEKDNIDMQLWYRNEDENGMTYHGPTSYDSDEIIKLMAKECLNKNRSRYKKITCYK